MATQRICLIAGCDKHPAVRGVCEYHYEQARRNGTRASLPRSRAATNTARKFLDAAVASNTDDCIIWPFGQTYRYAFVKIDGRNEGAHRIVCRAVHGEPESPGMYACHSCATPLCVNPRHLRWGTHEENSQDMVLHGHSLRGEKHHKAKLTAEDVRTIKSLFDTTPKAAIARMFGVTPCTIGDIAKGRTWTHL